MSHFLWNLVLALLWASMFGSVDPPTLFTGFVLGFLLLACVDVERFPSAYAVRVWNVARLVVRVAWEVLVSNVKVSQDIITPRLIARPAIYSYEMEARTDAEITLLTLIVSFTPGTLALELSEDRRILYVHVMFATDRESFRRQLHERVERPILRALR